jgi:hypothetical protein
MVVFCSLQVVPFQTPIPRFRSHQCKSQTTKQELIMGLKAEKSPHWNELDVRKPLMDWWYLTIYFTKDWRAETKTSFRIRQFPTPAEKRYPQMYLLDELFVFEGDDRVFFLKRKSRPVYCLMAPMCTLESQTWFLSPHLQSVSTLEYPSWTSQSQPLISPTILVRRMGLNVFFFFPFVYCLVRLTRGRQVARQRKLQQIAKILELPGEVTQRASSSSFSLSVSSAHRFDPRSRECGFFSLTYVVFLSVYNLPLSLSPVLSCKQAYRCHAWAVDATLTC